jgi:enoyl-CoA hydratase
VVLRGAGRSFCAGYDLTAPPGTHDARHRGSRTIDDDAWQLERAQRLRMALFDMHKPVIAQVHGHCLAGGTDVALLCDMVIAAEDAVFGFPPARDLGTLPNNMWLYHVGPQWAKRLLLTGDTITGAEAAKIGLVLKAGPAELLSGRSRGSRRPPRAHRPRTCSPANKRIVNVGLELMGARTLQRLAARTTRARISRRARVSSGYGAREGAQGGAPRARREVRRRAGEGGGGGGAGREGEVEVGRVVAACVAFRAGLGHPAIAVAIRKKRGQAFAENCVVRSFSARLLDERAGRRAPGGSDS